MTSCPSWCSAPARAGLGSSGSMLHNRQSRYKPVALLDDDPRKQR